MPLLGPLTPDKLDPTILPVLMLERQTGGLRERGGLRQCACAAGYLLHSTFLGHRGKEMLR